MNAPMTIIVKISFDVDGMEEVGSALNTISSYGTVELLNVDKYNVDEESDNGNS